MLAIEWGSGGSQPISSSARKWALSREELIKFRIWVGEWIDTKAEKS